MANERLLFIEDNRELIFLCSRPLQRQGFDVTEAWSAEKALQILQKEAFHLVVTDLRLPGGSGFEVIAFLKQYHPDTRIIVVSGAGPEALEKARGMGVDSAIAKPFMINKLIDHLRILRAEDAPRADA